MFWEHVSWVLNLVAPTRSILSAKWALANKTRLIISVWRTVDSNRFQRLRVKNLHNCMSKKSRIDKVFAKLQHKVRGIFVRDEIFENSSQTQRICKGMHSIPYVYLCQSFVFALYFRKFCTEQKCLGLYAVPLRIIYRFQIFLDTKLCRFFPRRRLNRLNPTVLHAQRIKRVLWHLSTQRGRKYRYQNNRDRSP